MRGRIVVCGNLVQDIVVRPVAEPLAWDATVTVEQIVQGLGGNGGTTSFTLGRLGVPVTLMSLAGKDAVCEQLLERLRSAGIQTQVECGELPTSVSVSLVDERGRRALLYQLGASAGEFRRPVVFPEDAGHFHLNAVFRMQDLRTLGPELLRQAKACGLSTSIDAQWDHLGKWMTVLLPALRWTDLLFVNEDEAWHLTGLREPAAAARSLREAGAGEVVVKLGARGCFALTAAGESWCEALTVPVVDTTGAGDVFVGGYLAGLHGGLGHPGAALLANRMAGLSVGYLGATTWLDACG